MRRDERVHSARPLFDKCLRPRERGALRDCIYWRDEDFCANPQWQTGGPSNGLIEFPCTFPEDFCSYGEPKEEGHAPGEHVEFTDLFGILKEEVR